MPQRKPIKELISKSTLIKWRHCLRSGHVIVFKRALWLWKWNDIGHHYCYIVDVLCKTRCLNDANLVMKNMPFQPAHVPFSTFLSACRYNIAYVKQGEEVAFSWHELDRMSLIPYLMLGYIYTTSAWVHDPNEVVNMLSEKLMVERNGGSNLSMA